MLGIDLPTVLSPESVWDWGRCGAVLLSGILVGMTAEVVWSYRHVARSSDRARHVFSISTSYMIFAVLLAYANLFQIGRHSAVEAVTVPLAIAGSAFGIVGLYRILRVTSGKG